MEARDDLWGGAAAGRGRAVCVCVQHRPGLGFGSTCLDQRYVCVPAWGWVAIYTLTASAVLAVSTAASSEDKFRARSITAALSCAATAAECAACAARPGAQPPPAGTRPSGLPPPRGTLGVPSHRCRYGAADEIPEGRLARGGGRARGTC
eukprot:scaffold33087_cov107-Isochrysis_galbana.AAC.1